MSTKTNDDQKAARTLALAEKLRDIPTLSTVVLSILDLVNNPKSSATQVADILRRDQVLSAKLLRTINSSFYNLSTEITDIPKALGFLGFNTLSAIVLGTSVFSSFEVRSAPYFNVIEFWKHSLGAALAAELFAKHIRYARPEEAFSCGLLHDIGKVALFQVSKDEIKAVTELAKRDSMSFLDAEMALGLPGHAVLGERLAERWKLPIVIRKAIRFHHRDIETMESIAPNQKPSIMLATLGNVLVGRLKLGHSGSYRDESYPENYLQALNISPELLQSIEEKMVGEMDRAQGFLDSMR